MLCRSRGRRNRISPYTWRSSSLDCKRTMDESFEAGLTARVDAMLDACTRCGKCVEACPITEPAGVADAIRATSSPASSIFCARGDGTAAARNWANACVLSGECIKACDYGVNPRFLLAMARRCDGAPEDEPRGRRRKGRRWFPQGRPRRHACSRACSSRTNCWNGSASARRPVPRAAEAPDFVFYTGCNVLKTPHIALLALDIMDALGVTYQVMGGPTPLLRHRADARRRHRDLRPGRREHARQARRTAKPARCSPGARAATCSSPRRRCRRSSDMRGARPFEMTPFMLFLASDLDQLKPLLRERGADADRAASPPRHPGRHGGGRGAPARGARYRDRRAAASGGRVDEQCASRPCRHYQARIPAERARGARSRRRRRAGRGLSFRPSRTVRARARLAVPHPEHARDRRRQHGAQATITSSG